MKRWLIGIGVVFLLSAIAVSAHLYVIQRMVTDAGLGSAGAGLAKTVVWSGFAAMLAQPFVGRVAPRWLASPLSRFASTWMALLFWLLVALGVSDALLAISGGLDTPRVGALRAAGVASLVLALAAVAHRGARRAPRDVRVEIELARWPSALDGYRVVQLSDIHIGPALGRRFAEALTRRVNALGADLVVLTGDLVDGSRAALEAEVAPFRELRGRDGVFFVTGNHDFYSGAADWCECVSELGIRVLRNEHVVIGGGDAGASFVLAGVDDHRSGGLRSGGGEDLERALDGRPGDLATLLLAHDPTTFKRAQGMGIDLQLSGHTHGGQIWPFHYLVRLAVPFVAGRYRRGGAELYVSRGTGFWGPAMRLGAPAEVTEIVLRAPSSGSTDGTRNFALPGTAPS